VSYRPDPLRGVERLSLRLVHVVPVLSFQPIKLRLQLVPRSMNLRTRPLAFAHQVGDELLRLVEDERSRISRHIAPSGGASPKQSLATSRSAEYHRTRELARGCSTSSEATGRTSLDRHMQLA